MTTATVTPTDNRNQHADAGRPAVLIVDDEPSIREFLAFVLEDEGFEVATAADGRQALQQAREHPPDVVLTDLMMPVVDGYELINGLRREGVPVRAIIAMSAVQAAADCPPAADLFVSKPFQIEQIIASVRALLRAN
jgi:two-component system, OmpR family, response regulator